MTRRLKLLAILGDGGHTTEIVRLVELLGPHYDYTYLITTADRISEDKITISGPIYRIVRPRAKRESAWRGVWNLARSSWQGALVLYRVHPDVVLGSGPAVMVPVALLGKLTGASIVFVETASRVTDLSLTGKIMLKVADLFFVQWEELRDRYAHTIYAGRLL